jgi:hypothetical protein
MQSRIGVVMRKPKRVIQIYDDSFYKVGYFDQEICCHCGLTHRLTFKLEDGVILGRHKQDQRITAAERKRRGITELMQKVLDAQKPKEPT